MRHKPRIALLVMALIFLACGPAEGLVATPTPTSYSGIDEPAVLEGVEFHCSGVPPNSIDVEITFTSSEYRDHLSSLGEEEDAYPSGGHIFYTLIADEIEVCDYATCTDLEAIGNQLTLSCGDDPATPHSYGLDVGEDSTFSGFTFTFEVPEEADMSSCEVRLPDGSTIPGGSAFE